MIWTGRSFRQRLRIGEHGVPELTRYLAGEISLDEAARLAVVVTGQYAKRQFTWLRHQVQKDYILEEQYNGSSTPAILNNIRHFLLTLPD